MGQVCTATSRLYVEDSIYDKFVEGFKEFTAQTSVAGSQFDPKVNHGPQVSKAQHEKILGYIQLAKNEGVTVSGGTAREGKGFFVEPTILTGVNDSMKVVREEIFGPVVVIQSFKTEEEAIERANDTEYGLGAAVFTQDIVKGHRVAGAIQAGTVWVSKYTSHPTSTCAHPLLQINSSQDSSYAVPFGGYKQSGIGRELGEYALSAYTEIKAVHGRSEDLLL
jgi:aldehyde dehydrogenase (NAD+)